MKETIVIAKAVGRNATNRSQDVTKVQNRLNKWIAFGRLPGLDLLSIDGLCGPKTKRAIGAFQVRYLAMKTPDKRIDVNGETLRFLCMDYSQGNKPVGDPVKYDDYMKTPVDTSDDTPYWEKRGMFWWGVGVKGSASGTGISIGEHDIKGADLTMAAMYNLKNEDNRFKIAASTRRVVNFGGGYSGSMVLCFATGMYHPEDFNKIQSGGVDFNLAIGAKWLSLARWAAKLHRLEKIVTAVQVAKYADGSTVSELTTLIKGAIAGFGINEEETQPGFVAIDLPFLGVGMEASVYYGITSYNVISTKLT